MGQGGSISQNKSIILSNWVQMKQNSSIYYNKVTNQQIERHQVLINNKQQLSSYVDRMQDQSALICRLIYFHPKSMPKDSQQRRKNTKLNPPQNQINNRVKSMASDDSNNSNIKKNPSSNGNENREQYASTITKVYCVYTDRMIPIKQWNKDKIINAIQAFKKLIKTYGLFKVRQNCVCENQRKQIKVWINENPISNFPLETVQSQEDMIADLAALLVSRKQKIAKQLLDLQFFDQVIQHMLKLQQQENKIFSHGNGHNTGKQDPSNRQNKFTTKNPRQSETSNPNHQTNAPNHHSFHPSEVNNFYNVFINTDNSYTLSSSLQNSKYNIINKGSFNYPNYKQKATPAQQYQSEAQNDQTNNKQTNLTIKVKQKAQNDLHVKKQYSPSYIPAHQLLDATTYKPSIMNKKHQENSRFPQNPRNQQKNNQNINKKDYNQQSLNNQVNYSSYTPLVKQSKKMVTLPNFANQTPINQLNHNQDFQIRQLTQNTSIMMYANKESHPSSNFNTSTKNSLNNTEKRTKTIGEEPFAAQGQNQLYYKKTHNNVLGPPPSTHFTSLNNKSQHPNSSNYSRVTSSLNQQIQNISKNNSCEDINQNAKHKKQYHVHNNYFQEKKQPYLSINTKPNKQSFLNSQKKVSFTEYLTPQGNALIGKQKTSQLKRNAHFNEYKYASNKQKQQSKFDCNQKQINNTEIIHGVRSQSKVIHKSNFGCFSNQHGQSMFKPQTFNRNVVSQMSTLKSHHSYLNPTDPTYGTSNNLQKKSFPKYFQEKQSTKSTQKHIEKSVDQRQKSRAILGQKLDKQISPHKYGNHAFGSQTFNYNTYNPKDITKDIVVEVHQSETCSQQIIPPTPTFLNDQKVRFQSQNFQQRRKFPSTIQYKSKKEIQKKYYEQTTQIKKKSGTQIDSQQSCFTSNDATRSNFMDHLQLQPPYANTKVLKKSNNTCFQQTQINKNNSNFHNLSNPYFSYINTNKSLLISHSRANNKKIYQTDIKRRKQFEFGEEKHESIQKSDEGRSGLFNPSNIVRKDKNETSQKRQNIENQEKLISENRNLTFPSQQIQSVQRKQQKQFTFFDQSNNANVSLHAQKPIIGIGAIQQLKPFQKHQKQLMKHNHIRAPYIKKQSMNSNYTYNDADEEKLPRTTADERQKRTFKPTRTSQILIQVNELHSSDPSHKIQQLVQRLQKEKQKLQKQKLNVQTVAVLNEKLDIKQYPKFKKWQPSLNVYGSIINQQAYQSSGLKKDKKEDMQSDKNSEVNNNSDGFNKQFVHDLQQQHQKLGLQKKVPSMVESQNLESKKKIRKQVFLDYKGLFGDDVIIQNQKTEQQRQKARKMQIKKRKQQQQRMLQNTSSKDLLIQEKVQKQREKHAQLKNDLSKLFKDDFM